MLAKGPQAGATPKEDALKVLPAGTACRRMSTSVITGYIVELPDGTQIASAGSSNHAWRNALDWVSRNSSKLREVA